jgi:hypothetical protein
MICLTAPLPGHQTALSSCALSLKLKDRKLLRELENFIHTFNDAVDNQNIPLAVISTVYK